MSGIDDIRSKLIRLEADVAFLRGRLAAVSEEAERASNPGESELRGAAPEDPLPSEDEVEPDSRVLDGSTPYGGSRRRKDRSLEFVPEENAVLRLYGWANSSSMDYDVLDESDSQDLDAAKIRFLVRVPVDPNDWSKGATLKYVRLVRRKTIGCTSSAD